MHTSFLACVYTHFTLSLRAKYMLITVSKIKVFICGSKHHTPSLYRAHYRYLFSFSIFG
jgi:hypothetical protein